MKKILIIEDETSIAELEKDYLELSNFEVQIEENGREGLKRALEEEFDMFILDLMAERSMSYTFSYSASGSAANT